MKSIILNVTRKKILILFFLALSFTFASNVDAATLTITPPATAVQNDNIVVNIVGTNFLSASDISVISFWLTYDNTILSYTGYSTTSITGNNLTIGTAIPNVIGATWDGGTGAQLTMDNQTFFSLNFTVLSGSTVTTEIGFNPSSLSASNNNGDGVSFSMATGTISLNPVVPTIPATPNAPSITSVGNGSVTLAWTAPANGNSPLTAFDIGYRTGANAWATSSVDDLVLSTTISGLANGSIYDFRVSAVNAIGSSSPSSVTQATPRTIPSAPATISAQYGNAQVTVTWSAAVNGGSAPTAYNIGYRTGANAWATTTVGSTTSGVVSSLNNGTSYDFRVSATNAAGTGPVSSTVSETPRAVPVIASVPTASSLGQTSATLNGSVTSNGGASISELGFAYGLTTAYGATTTGVTVVQSGAFSKAISGLTCGNTYHFRAYAINSEGLVYSSDASFQTTACPGMPTITSLSSSVTGMTTATVSANVTSDGGSSITSRGFEYGTSGTYTATSTYSNGTGAYSVDLTGLSCGITYTYRAYAGNAVGMTRTSGSTFTTSACPTAPSTPSAPSATPGNTSVALTWSAPANGGSAITGYDIGYRTGSNAWATSTVGAVLTTTISGLVNGTVYDFRVSAVNAIGSSSPSSVTQATPRTIPSAPATISAQYGNAQVTVTWSAAVNGGSAPTAYNIGYRTGANAWATTTVGSTTSGVVSSLNNGTSYDFRVSATNAAGTGPVSSTVSETPRAVPVISSATAPIVGTSTATLSSSMTSTGGSTVTASGFAYGLTTAYGATTTNTVQSGAFSSALTGLTCGTTYHFRAYATNAVGLTYTADATFLTTCPGAPTLGSITAGSITKTSATLSSSISSTGYETVYRRGFEYGPTTAYGSTITEDGDFSAGSFSTNITGLTCGSTYHIRAYAVNYIGTSTTADSSFRASSCSSGGGGGGGGRVIRNNTPTTPTNLSALLAMFSSADRAIIMAILGSSAGVVTPPAGPIIPNTPSTPNTNYNDQTKFNLDLGLGSNHTDVYRLQKYLNTHGYVISDTGAGKPGNESYYYGEKTIAAVKRLQIANNITPATGYFGPITRAFINGDRNTPVAPASAPVPTPTQVPNPNTSVSSDGSFDIDLQLGNNYPDVLRMQKYLNSHGYIISATGEGSVGNETSYFGEKTYIALKKFQKDNGLPETGYFGPATRKLFNK